MNLSQFTEIILATSKSSDGNMKFSQGDLKETLENRINFLNNFGLSLDSIIDTNVQQGNKVLRVRKNDLKKGAYEDTTAFKVDGLITNESGVYLFLTTADCLPIAVFDSVNKVIALIHAGWRGLDLEVIKNAINKMKSEFNSDPKDLVVSIGPSIGPCHYKKDLWKQTEDQLIDLGILSKNINNPKICTYENEKYFSHRRAEDKKLPNDYRFATILGLKS